LDGPCPGCGSEPARRAAGAPGAAGSPGTVEPRGSVAPARQSSSGRALTRGRTPRSVLIRDLLIFELKLFLDGLGDLVFSQLAILALIWDFIRGGPEMGRTFYTVLRFGERWDLWLNLYRPATETDESGEGLLSAGKVDANSLLGRIEEMVKERGVRDPKDPQI
jgi:hypothetical protein